MSRKISNANNGEVREKLEKEKRRQRRGKRKRGKQGGCKIKEKGRGIVAAHAHNPLLPALS